MRIQAVGFLLMIWCLIFAFKKEKANPVISVPGVSANPVLPLFLNGALSMDKASYQVILTIEKALVTFTSKVR